MNEYSFFMFVGSSKNVRGGVYIIWKFWLWEFGLEFDRCDFKF